MGKICLKDTCGFPVFSHGYCKGHQYLRTDKKFTKIKARSPERLKKDSQVELFRIKWNESEKVSEISGRDLSWIEIDSPLWRSCFAHILNKNRYPKYRTLKENIMLVHPDEHLLIDNGTKQGRFDYEIKYGRAYFDIFYKKQAELKQQYKNE